MSDPLDENETAGEMVEPSEAEHFDAKAEDKSVFSPVKESVGEGSAQLNTESGLDNTSDTVGNSGGQIAFQGTAIESSVPSESKLNVDNIVESSDQLETDSEQKAVCGTKDNKENELGKEKKENGNSELEMHAMVIENNHENEIPIALKQEGLVKSYPTKLDGSNETYSFDPRHVGGDDFGTEEEQAAFMKELENFFKERNMEFKPPKFYGEGLNCLKLWRAVTGLGGYDQVTACKLWRQVGESFKPPKTCTTVSWSFRCFYEKALLEYEKYKVQTGELQVPIYFPSEPMSVDNQGGGNPAPGSGRARRDAAARAMQGWHSQRLLVNDEVGDPVRKDKTPISLVRRDKHLKSLGTFKRKKSSSLDRASKIARQKASKPQEDSVVVDVGPPADWVKINVRRTKDCFEVYALVPGLLREEVHVQSDPAGRLIISGEPEQPDNPWGVTPFKKVITLSSRIDPHQTSAVVTLHGQLFVRAPFEQSDL